MMRPVASLVLASIVALAACSGSDGQVSVTGPDPVTIPPSTETPDTTEPETTTPDTEPDETTSTSSTTSTTTEPTPSTTLDPIDEIEAAVKQARLDGQAAFARGEADPTNEEVRAELAEFQTGARLTAALADLDDLARDGLAVRPGDPDLSRIVFPQSIVLPDGADSTEAFLQECRVNSDVLYTVADGEGTVEAIVDDGVFSYVSNVRYVLIDGRWKHESGERIERIAGRDAC